MQLRFVWADGALAFGSAFSKKHHKDILKGMVESGQVKEPIKGYIAGSYSTDDFHPGMDHIQIVWQGGAHPTTEEVRYQIQQELARTSRLSSYQRCVEKIAVFTSWGRIPFLVNPRTGEKMFGKVDTDHAEILDPGYSDRFFDTEEEAQEYVEDIGLDQYDQHEIGYVNDNGVVQISSSDSLSPKELAFIESEIRDHEQEKGELIHEIRVAATSEDTEPAGAGVGFLAEPHKELYPNLFRGAEKIPGEVREALKNHVLEPLSKEFADPDKFIYFTIYGSGISYNWDEGGDLDLQLWVDSEKFANTTNIPRDMDDLIADIRRIVQMVNFPSFNSLGLTDTGTAKEEATGSMLIQYYPKPGTGSKDDNLASQPYACYDLETDDWLVKPKPIKPKFYGDNFLLLMPKAKDIALQAEALLGEFHRNILNFQFWFAMFSRYRKKEYQKEYKEAMDNATQEKEGIRNLFDGVFGGRAEAYSPEGKGIFDERDMIQKLLEVWGTFQDLKHFARAPLPWEEQELPLPTSKWRFSRPNLRVIPGFGGPRAAGIGTDIKNQGGGTFINYTPADKTTGYWVSLEGREREVDIEWFNTAAVQQYLHNVHMLPGEYLGAWIDAGKVYLDATEWVPDLQDAVRKGLQRGQKAIWDIKNGTEIRLDNNDDEVDLVPATAKIVKQAVWSDIMEKAQRLRDTGAVQIQLNDPNHVVGQVQGDHGTYETEIWRDDPSSGTITLWNCDCPWSQYSWGRTRQWKKYEGRPCAHTLALYWTSLSQPVQQPGQEQIPGFPAQQPQPQPQVNLPDALRQTVPSTQPQPQPGSQPQPALSPGKQQEQMTIHFPGALSKWRKVGQFMNGDIVRANAKVEGYDDRGGFYVVPRNAIGEVIWSDENDTIAIFSIESGPLGPHNVRVTAPTEVFSLLPRTRGIAPRRRR